MSDTFLVFVGADSIELGCLVGDHWRKDALRVSIPTASTDPPIESLAEALQRLSLLLSVDGERQERRLHVLISDRWLPATTLPWSDALRSGPGADVYARVFLAASGHRLESSDRVVLDDAPAARSRLAVAYPAALVAALKAFAHAIEAELISMLPLSAAAWSCFTHRAFDALAVLEDGALSIGHGQRRLARVAVRSTEPDPDERGSGHATLRDQWRRMQLRDRQLGSLPFLRVLDLRSEPSIASEVEGEASFTAVEPRALSKAASLSAPLRLLAQTLDRRLAIDAVSTGRRLTKLKRAVVLVAIVSASVATLQAWRVRQHTGELSRRGAAAAPSAGVSLAPGPAWRREELPRVRAVNAAISELNMPVLALLSGLVPPRDLPVSILSVDVPAQAQRGGEFLRSVKILAEAESGEDMTRYVTFVSERKALASVYLVRHDVAVSDATTRPYRFTVEASWAP